MIYNLRNIAEDVKAIISDSLDLEGEKIALGQNLIQELGAESLDFLDIVFRVEEKFGVRVERGRIERQLREQFGDLEIKPNSDLTDDMKRILSEVLPEVAPERVAQLRKVKEIAKTFCVASFVRIACEALVANGDINQIEGEASEGFTREQLGCGKQPAETSL
jgi:acyl carrier protein